MATTNGIDIAANMARGVSSNSRTKAAGNSQTLTMTNFMQLLIAQLTNQDPMNPMSDSDMMAQLTQMATVEAMTTFTDISTTTYSASLVGKEVTVADVDAQGNMKEVCGTVTGAALYDGQQIIFIEGKSYYLTQIMAVGRLPEKTEAPDGEDNSSGGAGDGTDGTYVPKD